MMSTSGNPSSMITPASQLGSMSATVSHSQSGRGGAASVRRRRLKVTSEKKIADDEFMAAAIGDVEWLKQSLRENASQIHYDKNGLAALHLTAIHGRLECLKLCVEKFKQDVNLPSATGWRPVHLCISNQTGKRSLQCLTYLLEKGADPSVENDDGLTPVHQAASEGHVQCLKLLINVGAKIDGRDIRGNTPLDLAKLWAYRKCARILASEMWHQDKTSVAREMHQLKRVKMQQVLQELEQEEETTLAQQFYGQEAYDQWLSSRSPHHKHTAAGASPDHKGESLMKPNSVTSLKGNKATAEKGALTMSVSIGKKPSLTSKSSKRESDVAVTSTVQFDSGDELGASPELRRDDRKSQAFVNPSKWNFSPFISEKEYVNILGDDYPRSEYTMMHLTKNSKKYYDGKHAHSEEASDAEDLKRKKLRRPKLPNHVIEKALNGDPTLHERPIVFKTQHIADVQKKHKLSEDRKPVSLVPLHLGDDINSQLVKMSVRCPLNPDQDALTLQRIKECRQSFLCHHHHHHYQF